MPKIKIPVVDITDYPDISETLKETILKINLQ